MRNIHPAPKVRYKLYLEHLCYCFIQEALYSLLNWTQKTRGKKESANAIAQNDSAMCCNIGKMNIF